jgi:translation elongation factor aEF-1 beta
MSDKKDPGRISLLMRVLPEDVGTDLKKIEAGIKASLPEGSKLEGTEIKPFAFGLKALMCKISVPDLEGNADMIEEKLRGVPHVQGVEFVNMSRILG